MCEHKRKTFIKTSSGFHPPIGHLCAPVPDDAGPFHVELATISATPTVREESMSNVTRVGHRGLLTQTTLSLQAKAHADGIKTVFVIALENHNWTQPASQTSP